MKYLLGIDFGTLSARAAVVCADTGKIAGQGVSEYKHGIITENLPEYYALEDPRDILDALEVSVKTAVIDSGISPDQIVGIGLDATSYSMVSCDVDGNPMLFNPRFRNEPMAYIRLWKHHASQPQADRIAELHEKTGLLPQLEYFGGKVSPEFALPKILETLEKAPQLFHETSRFCDLGEWLVWKLSGKPVYSLFVNSFKSFYTDKRGFPSEEFLNLLDPGFGHELANKLFGDFADEQKACGFLTAEYAEMLGLKAGTPIAPPILDGAAPGLCINIANPDSMVITLGTSLCISLISEKCICMKGINAVAKDIFIPDYYVYDFGQPCIGDMLDWFVSSFDSTKSKAEIHRELTEKCLNGTPYKNQLTLLDWFNGNRSILHNENLKGCLIGLTMATKTEDMYCAMIQGACCGTAKIIEQMNLNGINPSTIVLCGGIAEKNAFYVNQLASILGRPVNIVHGTSMTILGSAIKAAVAFGIPINEAVASILPKDYIKILPDEQHRKDYINIYKRWSHYHDLLSGNWEC